MKLISKLFFSSLIGGFALFGLNWLLSFIGYSIPVNIFNAVFVGFLGVPGLITVIILSFIL
ncbi:MAG: pro-sigmaK processing inhibitor BofA family protein [Eubacteriaceae bacterium]|nr:pro-sigmaK processing inhibitor BofA family protein [Eubacteriaceae bacterium]